MLSSVTHLVPSIPSSSWSCNPLRPGYAQTSGQCPLVLLDGSNSSPALKSSHLKRKRMWSWLVSPSQIVSWETDPSPEGWGKMQLLEIRGWRFRSGENLRGAPPGGLFEKKRPAVCLSNCYKTGEATGPCQLQLWRGREWKMLPSASNYAVITV